ncbi:3-phytase [Leeuwenhoekiella polynyae]|uniref:3-phytase n=2 Tax=Leeuwenhoekiella polynyae TaxID=1550906 RepID=A0A4Q0P269_9FLAO|nr:3-phytase [Leeuwenhoekiella polynyae]
MIYSSMKNFKYSAGFSTALVLFSCGNTKSQLPEIKPDTITEHVKYDTDDPAIWINPEDASQSIVFGTDKDTDGCIFAFDLEGKIIPEKSIPNIKRPNNVDLRYGFPVNDSTTTDIIAFTERERKMLRIYSVPDMKPLDGGGFPVFVEDANEEFQYPMGVSLYKSAVDGAFYAIVGRKTGPLENYLYQYKITPKSDHLVSFDLVRKFGDFSGKKEIEAIAVDDALGFVYYSDEGESIKKYHAEPAKGNEQLAAFGSEDFLEDIEGIAIAAYDDGSGMLIVSDQQRGQFNIYDRKTNELVRILNLATTETDGCEVVTVPLNDSFKNGLFVAMNDDGTFYYYDLGKLK